MPTPGEKKALLFLSLVGVLGAGVRLIAATRVPVPTPAEVSALDAQIRAVDSVRQRGRREAGGGRRQKNRRSAAKRTADSAPGRDAAASDTGRSTQYAGPFEPSPASRASPVDVDRASIDELESLPGIGPALARRIAAARDSSGPFGSLDDLRLRVRGVGPALAKRLAPAVTFSAPRSPPSAERTEPFGNGGTRAPPKRRRGH